MFPVMTGNTLSAEALVRAAKKSKKSGNIKGCIEQMTRAIGLYCKLQKEKIDFVSLHLCEAYCLRALSLQETEPKSMVQILLPYIYFVKHIFLIYILKNVFSFS